MITAEEAVKIVQKSRNDLRERLLFDETLDEVYNYIKSIAEDGRNHVTYGICRDNIIYKDLSDKDLEMLVDMVVHELRDKGYKTSQAVKKTEGKFFYLGFIDITW